MYSRSSSEKMRKMIKKVILVVPVDVYSLLGRDFCVERHELGPGLLAEGEVVRAGLAVRGAKRLIFSAARRYYSDTYVQ